MKAFYSKLTKTASLLLAGALVLSSCSDDDSNVGPDYKVPTTYDFSPASWSGQTSRLNQLEELVAEVVKGNEEAVNADVLNAMFANTGGNGGGYFSQDYSKQLKSKTYELDTLEFEAYFESVEEASQKMDTASNGTSGYLFRSSGDKILVDAKGWELKQMIEKGIMGSTFFYQIAGTDGYISNQFETADNTEIDSTNGTDMEHYWDEGFGYFGVSADLTTTRYIAKYAKKHEDALGTFSKLNEAFIAGRAAISNDDKDGYLAAKGTVLEQLELVFAQSALGYLNDTKADIADGETGEACHHISEAVAFIKGLKFSTESRVSASDEASLLGHIGDNAYEVSEMHLNMAIAELQSLYPELK